MILRGIDYGPAFSCAGARGFYGEKYWHQKFSRVDYARATFIAKTVTAAPREGFMPLDREGRPRELYPRCMVIKPWKGVVLNAVGLANLGVAAHLHSGRWQRIRAPFLISFAAVGETRFDRVDEAYLFAGALGPRLSELHRGVGLQVNFSCPNAGSGRTHSRATAEEYRETLARLARLGLPLVAKFNCLEPIEHPAAVEGMVDAVSCSNTIPYGGLPDLIDWGRLFGPGGSPLARRGLPPGGLSGWPLLRPTADWVARLRRAGFRKPIVGGGGVMRRRDAHTLFAAGCDAVELGVVGMLRPWRVPGIVDCAYAAAPNCRQFRPE